MSEFPPQLPGSGKRLDVWFWVALFLPLALVALIVGLSNIGIQNVPSLGAGLLIPLAASLVICPLYCGIRLACLWSDEPATRVLLGFGLVAGLGCLYLAVAFGGCMTLM